MGVLVIAGVLAATLTLPDNASSHIYEAERLYERGDLVSALVELDNAVDLDPLNGEAHLLRGQIYARMGNTEDALADLGIALSFGHPRTKERALELIPEVRRNRGLNR
jgi:Flp pilus assembly protein TadD